MKSKKKLIVIILLSLIIVVGAVFSYLYFFTDMFKTPEQLFYKYASKLAKTEDRYTYQEMLDDVKTAQTKSYTGKTNVGIELKSNGNLSDQAMFNVINGIGLEIETKSNPSEKKVEYNLNLNYGNTKITNLELVRDNDTFGVKSEFLDDKYVAVENNNLKGLISKLGGDASEIPNKIEILDIYELLYVSKEDQNKIEETYKKIIKEYITGDKFKKEEIANTNTTVYSVEITEKEFQNLMLKLFETLKEDEVMLNLLVEKINLYLKTNPAMQSIMNGNSLTSSKFSKETLTQAIDNIIDELKDSAQYADEKSTAKFSLYVSNGEVVRIEYKLDDEVQMAVDLYKTDDINHIVVYGQNMTYIGYDSYYNYGKTYRKTSSELQKVMEIQYKKTKSGEEKNANGTLIAYENEEEVFKIDFDITTKGKTGEGKNESKCKFNIDIEELSIGLTIDSEVEFTDDVKIVDLTDKNSTILNNMSKAEIEKFFNKIENGFEEKLTKKMKSLNSVIPITSLLF